MFHLEQSIADWRKQMLAAGIQTPVPLEELEIHLREEIERQIKSGLDEQVAFNSAVQKIGQAGLLRTEFKKAGGFIGWLGENKSTRINRILGALWLAYCSWIFFMTAATLLAFFLSYKPRATPDLYFSLLFEFIFLRGIIASIRLFGGVTRDRRSIRMIALLGVVGGVAQIIISIQFDARGLFSVRTGILLIFNLASFWLLRPSRFEKPNVVND
jgi:hypothetical protein